MVRLSKPIHSMRNLISIFLALSLSWVTTGYACQMDGLNMVRAMCCCKHGHQEHQAKRDDLSSASVSAEKTRCCDVVSSSALGDQQPGAIAKVPSLDLPAFTILPVTMWVVAEPAPRLVSAPPPARGPPAGTGTRTYLTTARLRL